MRAIPGLSTPELAGLRNMVTGVKRDHVTAVQASDAKYVRHMKPRLRHDPLLLGLGFVTWVCLPYLSLEPYSGLLGDSNRTNSFPAPTLLQARYPRTPRNRDMQQVVCQQKGPARGLCLHVSQIWCLIIDNCRCY